MPEQHSDSSPVNIDAASTEALSKKVQYESLEEEANRYYDSFEASFSYDEVSRKHEGFFKLKAPKDGMFYAVLIYFIYMANLGKPIPTPEQVFFILIVLALMRLVYQRI